MNRRIIRPGHFCPKCGAQNTVTAKPAGYSFRDGAPVYNVRQRCPNKRWLFDGHWDMWEGSWGRAPIREEDIYDVA